MSDSAESKWTPSKTWAPSGGTSSWASSSASADPVDAPAANDEASRAMEKARLRIEERKVKLEESKETHRMLMESRRQDFLEMQINRDWETEAKAKDKKEHWIKSYWRPAASWLYMLVCFMDFIGFPAIYTFLPVINRAFGVQMQFVAWNSLTLSNGGLFHLAFGAILGVAAWSRGQEKMTQSQPASTGGFGGSSTGTTSSGGGFGGGTSSGGGFGSGTGSGFGR